MTSETPGDRLLAACGLSVHRGGTRILHEAGLVLGRGEVLGLLGRNGSGKTTLLRALAGLLDTSAGVIERNATVAYVPQDPNSLLFAPTVRGELEHTLDLLGRRDPALVTRTLVRYGLELLAARHPRTLSGGERQRVAVAAVAVGSPDVLLLDEPTRGMDADSRAALERALAEHTAAGGAAILATHDVELVARLARRALVLGDGEVVADGAARDVLAGSLFAPQTLRVLPPYLTVDEVARAVGAA